MGNSCSSVKKRRKVIVEDTTNKKDEISKTKTLHFTCRNKEG